MIMIAWTQPTQLVGWVWR